MALPASGQLSYSQINVELGNGATSQASMFAMATAASKSTTNAGVDDFYGYSHGDTITLSWGATTTYSNGEYRLANRAGHTSPQIITVNFTYNAYCDADGEIYYSKNSTSSWTLIESFNSGSISGNFSVTSVDYNDIIRCWWEPVKTTYNMSGNFQLNGGTVTSGSGTVSGTPNWLYTTS